MPIDLLLIKIAEFSLCTSPEKYKFPLQKLFIVLPERIRSSDAIKESPASMLLFFPLPDSIKQQPFHSRHQGLTEIEQHQLLEVSSVGYQVPS